MDITSYATCFEFTQNNYYIDIFCSDQTLDSKNVTELHIYFIDLSFHNRRH